jgi:hypothetical protein
MTMPDVLERLASTDPAQRAPAADERDADAVLASILADDGQAESAPRLGSGRRRSLATGALACAILAGLALILDLFESERPEPRVVEKTLAAVSSDRAIYHVVERFREHKFPEEPSIVDQGFRWDSTRFQEGWFGPGGRLHYRMFKSKGGRKGRVTTEVAGRAFTCRRPRKCTIPPSNGRWYNRRTNVAQPIGLGPRVPTSSARDPLPRLDPSSDPGEFLRQAESTGRLQPAGTRRVGGRTAYRLISPKRVVGPFNSTATVEFLVDAATYFPLRERLTMRYRLRARDLKQTDDPAGVRRALRTGRTLLTAVYTRRFLVYEKLPLTSSNKAKLKIHPRPGAVYRRPDGKRVPFRP